MKFTPNFFLIKYILLMKIQNKEIKYLQIDTNRKKILSNITLLFFGIIFNVTDEMYLSFLNKKL